jgi:2,3-dihydroxybenzoate-AMP ligase
MTAPVTSSVTSSAAFPGRAGRADRADRDERAERAERAERERRYVAEGWWTGETLPEYVLRRCAENPAEQAIRGAGTSLTWGELASQVTTTAGSLRRIGVRAGDRVLVQLPNEPGLIVLILALAQVGAAAVLAVPGLRERELRHVTETAGARLIAVSERAQRGANLTTGRRLAASCPSVRGLIVSGACAGPGEMLLADLIAGETPDAAAGAEDTRPAPSDVALYLLSGGTTGLPKLIPRTHRDYVCNLKVSAAVTGLGPGSTYLAAMPVCHNFALGCPGVLGTLAAGGSVVLTEARLVGESMELMAAEQVTITAAVPGLAIRWTEHVRGEPALAGRLRLNVVQVGGARLQGTHARELSAVLGCTTQQVYGMAEGLLCFTRLDDPPAVTEWTQGRPACPADEWRLVDETGRDVPAGQPGEMHVRGPYTIGAYLASDADNAAAFAPGGWYRTGDIARQHPSGNFVIEGRRKDFINCGGEKVSAEEIEELVVTHPSVAAAAAVAAPAELFGEEVCVFVTFRAGSLSLKDLRAHLTTLGVAPYKLPARMRVLDELPVTAVGKVDKAALRALARSAAGRE